MYKKDDIVKVKVSTIVPYGAFCTIEEPKYDDSKWTGLIHISEISDYYVSSIDDFFSVGDEFGCKVIEVLVEKNQLKLSFKAIREELLKPVE